MGYKNDAQKWTEYYLRLNLELNLYEWVRSHHFDSLVRRSASKSGENRVRLRNKTLAAQERHRSGVETKNLERNRMRDGWTGANTTTTPGHRTLAPSKLNFVNHHGGGSPQLRENSAVEVHFGWGGDVTLCRQEDRRCLQGFSKYAFSSAPRPKKFKAMSRIVKTPKETGAFRVKRRMSQSGALMPTRALWME